MKDFLYRSCFLLLIVLGAGCEPYQPPTATGPGATVVGKPVVQPTANVSSPLPQTETEYVVMIVMDLSGSFAHQMADEGAGYEFALQVYDRYFRNRIGNNKDELIIAQLSGTSRSLLWQGSPIELRHKFSSSGDFKKCLLDNADPSGSVIHDGLGHALEYMNAHPAVASGKANSAVFVLSDMLDNGPNPEASSRRIAKALSEYGQRNGIVGMYYVDQDLVLPWRRNLGAAGLRDFRVESIIKDHPDLPSF